MPRNFWQRLSGCLITVIVIGLLFIGKVFHDCTNGHHRPNGSVSATIDVSPDEKTIVFSTNGTGGSDLYLLDMNAQKVTRLTDTEDFEYSPRFSPDGRKIVFVSGNEQTRPDKLFMMELATRKVQKITQGDDNDTSPAFIQGGTAILFCRQMASE